jgi:hypothetical protein
MERFRDNFLSKPNTGMERFRDSGMEWFHSIPPHPKNEHTLKACKMYVCVHRLDTLKRALLSLLYNGSNRVTIKYNAKSYTDILQYV